MAVTVPAGELLPLITAHCFFAGTCRHVERGLDPDTVHAAMEAHYAAEHTRAIDRIVRDFS